VITPFVDETLAYVDQNFAVRDMPTLTPEVAAQRADSLASAEGDDLLSAVVELRYYHAMGWIDDATARQCCEKLLGAGTGQEIMLSDEARRRAALAKTR